ncbi:UNVERIFIED_CONTAM: hypothetical protein Sradi_2512400 [Sesamum radiatum]|uniref:Retrotransposon gag domain-containing protein n=1 Tax=Sesamum radiatum TaxID=300843 RepID=A0AAW2SMF2_SESRA
MKQQVLQRFFPASRATHLRKEIYGIRQLNGESLYEYWDRFKELIASYPHHQFNEPLLIQYFYEGLSGMDKRMVDVASRGALIDKTPDEAQITSLPWLKIIGSLDITQIEVSPG